MTYEKAIYWLDEIKRAYIKHGDEDFDRQRKEAIDLAIYCITEWQARKEVSDIGRPKGKWVPDYYIDYNNEVQLSHHTCSICREFPLLNGSEEYELSDFCPSCGADMRGEEA